MNDLLEKAIEYALSNPIEKRHGNRALFRLAAILTNGKRTYYGWNSWKTHPLQKRFGSNSDKIHLHAELDCIKNAINNGVTDFNDYTMYVARVLKNDTPALAKPCEGCQRALIHFNIHNVRWTT